MTLRAYRLLILIVLGMLLADVMPPISYQATQIAEQCPIWRENTRGEVGCADRDPEFDRPLSQGHRLALGLPMDLNRATAKELALIEGVGPAMAARIVESRPYQTVAELQRVSGIGPVRYRALERYFEVN